MFLPEFVEILSGLHAEGARFLVVGGYAFGIHHEPRATKDLDVFVEPTRQNAAREMRALRTFRAPMFGLTLKDLTTKGTCLQIGVAPRRIDMLTAIDGVSFDDAWSSRLEVRVGELPFRVPVLGRAAYIRNKEAIVAKDGENRRPQDRADLELLRRARPVRRSRKPR